MGTSLTVLAYTEPEVGAGPGLHYHDYDEIFLIRRGHARFTVGDDVVDAGPGDIVLGPAGIPHKFHNVGPGTLETTDLHLSDHIATVDVADPERS